MAVFGSDRCSTGLLLLLLLLVLAKKRGMEAVVPFDRLLCFRFVLCYSSTSRRLARHIDTREGVVGARGGAGVTGASWVRSRGTLFFWRSLDGRVWEGGGGGDGGGVGWVGE